MPGSVPSLGIADFVRVALFDGDLASAVGQVPIKRAGRQGHIKRDAIVAGGECLEVGADLVGDVAAGRGTIGADDDQVHLPALHEVAAGIVGDDRVADTVPAEFPGGQTGALVERPGLIDPHMEVDSVLDGRVNGRGRRAVFHACQPAGVAVSENVDRPARILPGDGFDQRPSVFPDPAAVFDFLLGNGRGRLQCQGAAVVVARGR